MADTDQNALRVSVMLEEFKELGAEVRTRIELQHRNMNVFLVLVTAVTGYLVKFASDHGLDETAESLVHNDLLALAALVIPVANVFLWRQLDHDVNIIDKTAYVNEVLRPDMIDAVGGDILGFETFLHERRSTRTYRLGPFLALGKEDVPIFLVTGIYLVAGWYLRLHVPDHAGAAQGLFDILLYVGSGLTLVSLWMAIAVGREYATLGKIGLEKEGGKAAPVGAALSESDSKQPEEEMALGEDITPPST
jgi:hypothetical protein